MLSDFQVFYTYCILSHTAQSLHTSQVVRGTSRTGGKMQFCRGSWTGSEGELGQGAVKWQSLMGWGGSGEAGNSQRGPRGVWGWPEKDWRSLLMHEPPCFPEDVECNFHSLPQESSHPSLSSGFTLLPLWWGQVLPRLRFSPPSALHLLPPSLPQISQGFMHGITMCLEYFSSWWQELRLTLCCQWFLI